MGFDIENKVVFISGGAGDIGSAIVRGFVREKSKIIIGDINPDAAEALKEEYTSADISICSLDVTSKKSVDAAAGLVKGNYGRIDVLVNVAGILCRESFFNTKKEDFEKSMAINVIGAFLLSQAMAEIMKEQGSGTIINISSLNGSAAIENRIVYGATKAALDMLSKSMAVELGEYGITANSVAPGVVDSAMCRVRLNNQEIRDEFAKNIPLGRLATPEDVCESVLFMASPHASYITGAVLLVDGGIIARQALPK